MQFNILYATMLLLKVLGVCVRVPPCFCLCICMCATMLISQECMFHNTQDCILHIAIFALSTSPASWLVAQLDDLCNDHWLFVLIINLLSTERRGTAMFYLEAELSKPPRILFALLTWLDNFYRLEMELCDLLRKDQI